MEGRAVFVGEGFDVGLFFYEKFQAFVVVVKGGKM